ncbi:hypothetical protein EDD21DRAFT_371986 [Dissophora ornata]|nr:hypothetical protein EDD21DRAFT_371986 [Dissophora ornata]
MEQVFSLPWLLGLYLIGGASWVENKIAYGLFWLMNCARRSLIIIVSPSCVSTMNRRQTHSTRCSRALFYKELATPGPSSRVRLIQGG